MGLTEKGMLDRWTEMGFISPSNGDQSKRRMSMRSMTEEAISGYCYDDMLTILRQVAYNLAEIADQLEALNGRMDDSIDENKPR